MLKVGDRAPEIDATATDGTRFVLSRQESECTVVYFYPRAFTTGCTAEAENFREHWPELVLAGAAVVGISPDSHETQCRFAEELVLRFPLIGDSGGAIAKAYGVRWPVIGLTRRVTFVIGTNCQVEAVFEHPTVVAVRPKGSLTYVEQVLAFLHARRRQPRPLQD